MNAQRILLPAILAVLAAIAPIHAGSAQTVGPAQVRGVAASATDDRLVVHLLNRIGYGPRPGDVERLKRMGVEKFVDLQLHPERVDDSAVERRLASLDSLRMSPGEASEKYPQPSILARRLDVAMADPAGHRDRAMQYIAQHGLRPVQRLLEEMQAQKLIRAVYSERQLQEVLVDFWFNHFNIDWTKGDDKWMTADYDTNAIRPHVLGRFKDLLMATAKSPAMLVYLDNFQSAAPDARAQSGPRARRRHPGINENYAREIMELHTLGVDGGYTQQDVQEVARCFTGWTIDPLQQGGRYVFRAGMHDDGEKTVLGRRIPAGGGEKDGERVIDILAQHPGTARFISGKLVRRFVSDDPPPALIDRVAATYRATGGDIREMMRVILGAPEFHAGEAYRAKIKSPFELAVSAIRVMGGDTSGSRELARFIARMGQPLYQYQAPTGYADRAGQWVNTGSMLERLNFGLALSSNNIPGAPVDVGRLARGTANSGAKLTDRAVAVLLEGDISLQTRAVLERQLKVGVPVKGDLSDDAVPAVGQAGDDMADEEARFEERPADRGFALARAARRAPVDEQAAKIFGLVLGSPEFQRR